MDAFKALPPVTRTLLLATAACTVPVLLALASVYPLVFIPNKIFGKMELWRLVTPFFYGGRGIPLVFDVFLLYRNSSDLEEKHFQRRTADYGQSWGPCGRGGEGRGEHEGRGRRTDGPLVEQLGR